MAIRGPSITERFPDLANYGVVEYQKIQPLFERNDPQAEEVLNKINVIHVAATMRLFKYLECRPKNPSLFVTQQLRWKDKHRREVTLFENIDWKSQEEDEWIQRFRKELERAEGNPWEEPCRLGDLEAVKKLRKECTPLAQNKAGETALHVACRWGNLDIVQYLWNAGGRASSAKTDAQNHTPLTRACEQGHIKVVRWLLEQDPSALSFWAYFEDPIKVVYLSKSIENTKRMELIELLSTTRSEQIKRDLQTLQQRIHDPKKISEKEFTSLIRQYGNLLAIGYYELNFLVNEVSGVSPKTIASLQEMGQSLFDFFSSEEFSAYFQQIQEMNRIQDPSQLEIDISFVPTIMGRMEGVLNEISALVDASTIDQMKKNFETSKQTLSKYWEQIEEKIDTQNNQTLPAKLDEMSIDSSGNRKRRRGSDSLDRHSLDLESE